MIDSKRRVTSGSRGVSTFIKSLNIFYQFITVLLGRHHAHGTLVTLLS